MGRSGSGSPVVWDTSQTCATDEVDSATPLSTLARALAAGSRPVLETDDLDRIRQNAGESFWAIRELRAALNSAAASRPVAIVIDDAGWADEASLQAVHILIREVADRPISWLLASRPETRPAYQRIRRLTGHDASHLVRLACLGGKYRAQIMRDLLGAEPNDDVIALVRGTERNLTDLVDRLVVGVQSGAVVVDGGQARLSAYIGVSQFHDAVALALARLSPSARRMIDIAAVLGRSFRLADVSALLNTPVPHLVTELRELLAENLVVDGGAALTFSHDLIRVFVLEALAATVCGALNRDVALHLLATGTPASDVAPYVLPARLLTIPGAGHWRTQPSRSSWMPRPERVSASTGIRANQEPSMDCACGTDRACVGSRRSPVGGRIATQLRTRTWPGCGRRGGDPLCPG